jgi:leucyl-tRNA synthetase
MPPDKIIWKYVKMSKSKRNVVTPDAMAEKFGADSLRTYELFVAPFEDSVQWSEDGMNGAFRFLNRVWRFFASNVGAYDADWRTALSECSPRPLEGEGQGEGVAARNLRRKTHQTIEKVTGDIERFHFNTAVSALMEMLNATADYAAAERPTSNVQRPTSNWEGEVPSEPPSAISHQPSTINHSVLSEAMEMMTLLLAPITPHLADELWEQLGKTGTTFEQTWPTFDPAIAKADTVTIVLQVNGKLRDRLEVPADMESVEIERLALASQRVQEFLGGKPPRKVIVVPGKLVNVVVG